MRAGPRFAWFSAGTLPAGATAVNVTERHTAAFLAVLLCVVLRAGSASADLGPRTSPSAAPPVSATVVPAAGADALPEGAEIDVPPEVLAKEKAIMAIPWQPGPVTGSLGALAEIAVPEGQLFVDGDGARRFLELNHNPTNGDELGMVAAADFSWVVTFEYSDIGHVNDDEKADLDAEALLASLREGNTEGNKLRQARGWSTLTLAGWALAPRYDVVTNNLEWATNVRGDQSGVVTVNHDIRLLGRTGVMEAGLLVSPENYQAALAASKAMLAGFSFESGQRYDEFRQGERVAELGLAGLITGGAIAAAAKTGFLAKAGKGVIKLVVLAGAGIATLAAKLLGKKNAASE